MNDDQTHKITDEQLADLDLYVEHERIQRKVRGEMMASALAEIADPPTAAPPIPMLERRGKTRVTLSPSERRAKARKKEKNRSKRKAPTDDMRKRQRYAIAGITDLLNEFDLPEHCADAEECLRKIGAYVLMGLDEES